MTNNKEKMENFLIISITPENMLHTQLGVAGSKEDYKNWIKEVKGYNETVLFSAYGLSPDQLGLAIKNIIPLHNKHYSEAEGKISHIISKLRETSETSSRLEDFVKTSGMFKKPTEIGELEVALAEAKRDENYEGMKNLTDKLNYLKEKSK